MSYLVTGAAGFLGYHTCRYLVEKGDAVTGVDIADFDYPDLQEQVTFLKGDIRDPDFMAEAMKGADAVIHCAAALPLWPRDEIYAVNVDGTNTVLQTAVDVAVPRVVFISSTAVYGIPEEHPVTEEHPLQGVGPYGESKIAAEAACLVFREKGLCVPILRPKTFAGPKRLGVFQILCDWVREGRSIPIIGSGRNRYQLLHIDDLVEAIHLASTAPADRANDTYNVGATEFQTMRKDLQDLLDFAGFGKRVRPIPSWLVIPVLKVLERIHLSPLYEWVYETADKDHYVSVEKLQSQMGWSAGKTTADVWIDTYRWYLDEYRTRRIQTGVSHRAAWDQGILRLVKLLF